MSRLASTCGSAAFLDVGQIGQGDGECLGHGAGEPVARGRTPPWRGEVLLFDEGHVQRVRAAGGAQDQGLDVVRCHPLDGCEKGPLIGVWAQLVVHEDAAAVLAAKLLQRLRDQVAETALGQRVLVGEKPVVGVQLQLACAAARRG